MDELINLVVKNPFILILIIGALYSLFKGKPKPETDNREQQQHQQREQRRQTIQNRKEQVQTSQRKEQKRSNQSKGQKLGQLSIEEQRERQMKRLKSQMASPEHQSFKHKDNVAEKRREAEVQQLHNSLEQQKFKRKVKSGLTKEGLLNSIVMAEVLGPPRAKKPYKSVIEERKS